MQCIRGVFAKLTMGRWDQGSVEDGGWRKLCFTIPARQACWSSRRKATPPLSKGCFSSCSRSIPVTGQARSYRQSLTLSSVLVAIRTGSPWQQGDCDHSPTTCSRHNTGAHRFDQSAMVIILTHFFYQGNKNTWGSQRLNDPTSYDMFTSVQENLGDIKRGIGEHDYLVNKIFLQKSK